MDKESAASGSDDEFDSFATLSDSSSATTTPKRPLPISHNVDDHFPPLSHLESSTTLLPLDSGGGAGGGQLSSSSLSMQPDEQDVKPPRKLRKKSTPSRCLPKTEIHADPFDIRANVQELISNPNPPSATPVIHTEPSNIQARAEKLTGKPTPPSAVTALSSAAASASSRLDILHSPAPAASSPPPFLPSFPQRVPCIVDSSDTSSTLTGNSSFDLEQIESFEIPPQIPARDLETLVPPFLFQEQYATPDVTTSFEAKPQIGATLADYGVVELDEAVGYPWLGGASAGTGETVGDSSVDSSSKQDCSAKDLPESEATEEGQGTVEPRIHSSN